MATGFRGLTDSAWPHGLKIVAAGVVAQTVWGMAKGLCPDRERTTIAVGAAMIVPAIPSAQGPTGAIFGGGLIAAQAVPRPLPSS